MSLKMKELSTASELTSQNESGQSSDSASEGAYTYSRLKFDILQPGVSFRLPPRPYAFHLLQVFEEGFCDYHWFLRKKFRERLSLTYSDPGSQSGDRNWLCRVSVVLALAETWIHGRMTSLSDYEPLRSPAPPDGQSSPLPPGSDFFEQSLMLLKTSSEEPVAEDVEALNLIAFYSYSLNRRKTAYAYASQSIALSKLLHLNKPRTFRGTTNQPGVSARVHNEHRKRLWWTSYCMDRMTTTELGLSPLQTVTPDTVELPSTADLTPSELEEFFDAHVLAAQAQMCEIKRNVANTVTRHLRVPDSERTLDALKPCLDMLQHWRFSLPIHMSFEFENGIPAKMMELPVARVLSSLYLRYNCCFILLLRPFYLQDLSQIMQKRDRKQSDASSPGSSSSCSDDAVQALKSKCLLAARNSCKILLGLCQYGKIAQIAVAPVGSPSLPTDVDAELYVQARALLEEMARVGNPAAKDHEKLLTDVEAMVTGAAVETGRPQRAGDGDIWNTGFVVPNVDFGMGEVEKFGDMDWEQLLNTYTQGL
ncbi:hypothetical protein ACHAQA_005839 [Verticillium albo-atrum]